MDFIFTCPNMFLCLLPKVMDDQSVHPCEPVNQSFDNDSTETDESKEESKDDDAKESLTGKKAIIILELNRLPVCFSFSKDFSV